MSIPQTVLKNQYDMCSLLSEMSKLESKVNMLTDLLAVKELELQAIARKVLLDIQTEKFI